MVCHQALVAAYASGQKTVSAKLVRQAAAEILSEKKATGNSKIALIVAAVLVCSAAVLAVAYKSTGLFSSLDTNKPVAETPVQGPDIRRPAIAVSPATKVAEDQSAANTNPLTGLLSVWGINAAEVYSEEELSSVAGLQQLRMEKVSAVSLGFIEKINRPGIVWLLADNGYLKTYVLSSLDTSTVTLEDRQGAISIDRERFAKNWNGVYLYLWKPPLGYSAPLVVTGNSRDGLQINPQVVDWLQLQLQAINQDSERVISGGRYTSAVAQQVLEFQQQQGLAADGILGRETVMRLNQFAEETIPRLMEIQ